MDNQRLVQEIPSKYFGVLHILGTGQTSTEVGVQNVKLTSCRYVILSLL